MALLAATIRQANTAYHTDDAPEISDADYDAIKARLSALEEAEVPVRVPTAVADPAAVPDDAAVDEVARDRVLEALR